MKTLFLFILLLVFFITCPHAQIKYSNDIIKTGAEQTEKYIDRLKGKKVGLVANQTSIIGHTHLLDSLLKRGVEVVKVFGPEHGFRGNASNGTEVNDEKDSKTGVEIVSLYGKKKKPTQEDLKDIDIMIFDIQDVGCRFYTNINTLRDVMESCARYGKELLILDRPNPNAYFIDGPILDMNYKSGIGQFPIPAVHGLTVAEFAQMVNGEGWMEDNLKCKISIVKNANYSHDLLYKLPVNPSPNLNTPGSILLYPSTCLFEGVSLNHGRGTDFPFTRIGGPMLKGKYKFSYTPRSIPGMSENPLYKGQVCYGIDLINYDLEKLVPSKQINLSWMKELYAAYPDKKKFFDRSLHEQIGNIDFLAGTPEFKKQIQEGWSEEKIRASWKPGLEKYKRMREKYLIYPD
jgi:uncharacterized protein YbbC (DUF1343 family)